MSFIRKINKSRLRRKLRTSNKLKSNKAIPRISVFRSLKQVYAQLIDDTTHRTIASCSSLNLDVAGDKKAIATAVGLALAKQAKEKGIEAARFDRGAFLYHGRVKALAEGLREGGLKI
jgi:large subunit ribosomal protein L18